jgi:hypothetical protein
MAFLQHIWDLALLLVIVFSPVPLGLWIVAITTHRATLRFAHCSLVTLVVWCCLQTVIALLLGSFHALRLDALIVVEVMLLLMGLLLLRSSRNQFLNLSKQLTIKKFDQQELIIAGAFVCVFLSLLAEAVLAPITNYDSLAYHLPVMAEWYQVGYFSILDQFKLELIGYYPYSWEALCLLMMFPFRSDIFVTLPNLLAWVLFGLATYLVSQKLSAERVYSLAASLFVLILPLLTRLINSMHVDLPFAAFFMSAFYLLLVWWESRFASDFVLVLLSISMMLGIKTSAIPYGALLALALGICVVLMPQSCKPWFSSLNRQTQKFVFLGGVIAAGLGSFWYVRNLILLQNPFGLLRVKIANLQVFPGTIDSNSVRQTTLASAFKVFDLSDWFIVAKQVALQLGLPFALIVLPILMFVLTSRLRPPLKTLITSNLILITVLVVCNIILYWNTPYSGSNDYPPKLTNWMGQGLRYAFPSVALLGVFSAISSSLMALRKDLVTATCLFASLVFLINCWV